MKSKKWEGFDGNYGQECDVGTFDDPGSLMKMMRMG